MMDTMFTTNENNIRNHQMDEICPKKLSDQVKLLDLRDQMSRKIASEFLESKGVLGSDDYSNIILEFVKSTDHTMETDIKIANSNLISASLSHFIENFDNSLMMSSSISNPQEQSFNGSPELELVFDDYILNFSSICSKPRVAQSLINFHHKQLSSIVEDSRWVNHTHSIETPKLTNGFRSKHRDPYKINTINVTKYFCSKDSCVDSYLKEPRPQPYVNVPESNLKSDEIPKLGRSKKRVRSTEFDDNNYKSKHNGMLSSRIEHIQYSEIQTPTFKLYKSKTLSNRLSHDFIEEISDKAYTKRHEHFEMEEHTIYLNGLQNGRKNTRRHSNSSKSHAKFHKDGKNRDHDSLDITFYDEDICAL